MEVSSKLDMPLNDIISENKDGETSENYGKDNRARNQRRNAPYGARRGGRGGAAGGATGGRPRGASDLSYNRVVKVGAKSDVKTVAGSISHNARNGDSPTIMATGATSLNQAVKAIAIARGYLDGNKLDLLVRPEFRDESRSAMSFVLIKVPSRRNPAQPEDQQELRVAQSSEPAVVAGSIAKKVRAGERVTVVSIGAGSVAQTIRAVTIARRYLENDGVDISFRPEFIHVDMKDGQRSALRFTILAQQV